MRNLILTLALLGAVWPALAQQPAETTSGAIPITDSSLPPSLPPLEPLPAPGPTAPTVAERYRGSPRWQLNHRTEAYVNFSEGNTVQKNYTLAQESSVAYKKNARLEFKGDFIFSKYFDLVMQKHRNANLKYIQFIDPHWGPYYAYDYLDDREKAIEYAHSHELGVRLFFEHTKFLYSFYELGYRYKFERLRDQRKRMNQEIRAYAEVRYAAGNRYVMRTWVTFTKSIRFEQNTYVYFEPGVDVYLTKSVYFRLAVDGAWRQYPTFKEEKAFDIAGTFAFGGRY